MRKLPLMKLKIHNLRTNEVPEFKVGLGVKKNLLFLRKKKMKNPSNKRKIAYIC